MAKANIHAARSTIKLAIAMNTIFENAKEDIIFYHGKHFAVERLTNVQCNTSISFADYGNRFEINLLSRNYNAAIELNFENFCGKTNS